MKKLMLITLCTLIVQTSAIFSSEPSRKRPRGSLHIVTGSMRAGKSDRIIEITKRLLRNNTKRVLAVKHGSDDRKLQQDTQNPTQLLSSRTGTSTDCVPVALVSDLATTIQEQNPSDLIIDEAQFFTPKKEFIQLILDLRKAGKRIILSGLDVDFRGEPFGPMPDLLAYANSVEKLTANCAVCGEDTYCITQRLVDGKPARYNDPLIMVGDSAYEPRCINCHECKKE